MVYVRECMRLHEKCQKMRDCIHVMGGERGKQEWCLCIGEKERERKRAHHGCKGCVYM